jgi:ferredoxin--NADP+ reductase
MVSLNPIMIDGTGMCGVCRVSVGGETKFACVDGPDFNGHQVDFEELSRRLKMFVKDEKITMDKYLSIMGKK